MIATEITRGIPHFEDLSHKEILHLLTNLGKFQITEKVDGAQILFGIDENGFYTSRETKGGKRIYNEADYGITFASTYMRSAHKILEHVLPSLREAGLRPGDQVEAEVLFGELPNVVPYSEDTNYLIFLRTTEGDVNIDRLQQKLREQAVSVSLMSPYTENGKSIELREETNHWEFSRVPTIKTKYDSELITRYIREMKRFLSLRDPYSGQELSIILETPLNKIPDWVKPGKWKEMKEYLKERREDIRYTLDRDHVLRIKDTLLDSFVRNKPSYFGPSIEEGGWIEGVVLREKGAGKMVKLVDKDTFGKIRESAWIERNELTENAKITEGQLSFMGATYVEMATAIGHPELGTTQAKNYLRKTGYTAEEVVPMLAKEINFRGVRTYWSDLFEFKNSKLLDKLEKYEKEMCTISEGTDKNGSRLDKAIRVRTLQTFAQTFEKIIDLREETLRAVNSEDLLLILIGKHLEDK